MKGKVRIGRRQFRMRDVALFVILLATFLAGLSGAAIQSQAVQLAAIIGLLTAVALYLVEVSTRAEDKADDIHRDIGKIEKLHRPDEIYDLAMEAIDSAKVSGRWDRVRIYAPTGLWDRSERKVRWLSRLAAGLSEDEDQVGEMRGVYGLPKTDVDYTRIEARVKLFEAHPNVRLHYLPPPDDCHPTSAPAFGIIIFERGSDYQVYFGFGGNPSNPVIGYGFGLHSADVGKTIASWFDEQIFHGVSASDPMKDGDTDLRKGMERARAHYPSA